jgi:chemotaxis protein methyltransferase CheR
MQHEVAAVRDIVSQRCGFFLGEPHERYLRCRVSERIQELGSEFSAYLERLEKSPVGGGELQVLVERLCIYETRFMRDPADFRALACCILPLLTREMRRTGRRRLRVVSAGCSTGQEAYTLAMILHEAKPELRDLAVEVVGLDISGDALQRARSGRYSDREVATLDPWRREHYFLSRGKEYEIVPWLREGVRFLQCNLTKVIPITQVEVIFCRNVLIYFSPTQRQEVIRSLLASLRLGGFVVVGSADSTWEHRDVLQAIRVSGTIVYRRFRAMDVNERPRSSGAAQASAASCGVDPNGRGAIG